MQAIRLALVVLVVQATSARADALESTRDQPLVEVSHTVEIRIENGVAKYIVQRQFKNPGKVADEARLAIDLPYGAAATGMRIRAKTKWYDGELLEREDAAVRYIELTSLGVHDPKDPALLFWLAANQLYLQVFPILPGATSTVEYTLTAPTRYADGRYWLTYPRVDPDPTNPKLLKLAAPVIAVRSTTPVAIDGKPIATRALAPAIHTSWEGGSGTDLPTSTLDVASSPRTNRTFDHAQLELDVRIADRQELQIELVSPTGARLAIHDGLAGEPLKQRYDVALPPEIKAAGTWRLYAWSTASQTGTLVRWALAFGDTRAVRDLPALITDVPDHGTSRNLASISVGAPAIAMWASRLGRAVASDAHAFTRLELDVAPQLTPLPKRAQVVFVIDASWSAGPKLLAAQLAIIRAYASHVPDAQIEVVAYRRTAKRVFGKLVTGAAIGPALDDAARRGALALGNGSALDDGAKLAASVLAGRPGPHRVIITTDQLLRASLTEPVALQSLAALDPAAIVHVVVPVLADDAKDQLTSLVRDDAANLAPLATTHHGIYATLNASGAELARTVLELVRPTRVDNVAATNGVSIGDTLVEGQGVRLFYDGPKAAAPTKLLVTGKLWSDPVRLDVDESPAFTKSTAAFVFGADKQGVLSDAEMMTLAKLARVVSPVTSYLAIEPGVRPSKIGLDGGGTGWGTIGAGRYGTIGHGSGSGWGPGIELEPVIDTKACVAKHTPSAGWAVKLAIETTNDEIVDVVIKNGSGPLADCLVEAAWATRLDKRFDLPHDSFVVDLFGP